MGSFLYTTVSFIVALGVLITVHEFGHFWVARKLGVRVLRFSVGFGKPLWKRIGKVDGTEYVIASLPLGGYVKMLDEREGEVPDQERHRAFNRQSLGVRTAIVAAGPLFNFLFAIIVYWAIFVGGDEGIRPVLGPVQADSVAAQAGLNEGDELVSVNGRATPTWEATIFALLVESMSGDDLAVQVVDAQGVESLKLIAGDVVAGSAGAGPILSELGISPWRPVVPPVFGELVPGEAADNAGLRAGDRILFADGQQFDNWQDWVTFVQERPDRHIDLRIQRAAAELDVPLHIASVTRDGQVIGRIGARPEIPDSEGMRREFRLGPLEAAGAAVGKTWDLSWVMVKMLGWMVTGRASVDNLSGPISIAQTAGKSATFGVVYFLKFLAVVSISLGVLNLLPIPILDGGHLFYFLIEAVKGAPLSEQAQLQGQRIGILLLLALMTLAFYVDIARLLG